MSTERGRASSRFSPGGAPVTDSRQVAPLSSPVHRLMARTAPGLVGLVIAAIAMVAFGVVGIGRHGAPLNGDMRFLYAAGRAWLAGRNPYVLDDIIATTPSWLQLDFAHLHFTFAYPPQASLLSIALGAVDLGTASVLMVLLNLVAVVALSWCCLELAAVPVQAADPLGADAETRARVRVVRWMVPILVLASPFTQHVLFMGQTSLLAVALLVGGWYLAYARDSVWVAGVLLGASTIKPQLTALPLLLLALERRAVRLVIIAAATSFLLAAPALVINGPIVALKTWLGAVDLYRQGDVQVAGFQHVFGIQSLFAAGGVAIPNLFLLGLGVVGWVHRRTRRLTPCERLGLALAASLLFFYSHDYDLVALAPLFAALWMGTATSTSQAVVLLVAIAGLSVPQRMLRMSMSGPILHWRECIVLALVSWRLIAVRREQAAHGVAARVTEPG